MVNQENIQIQYTAKTKVVITGIVAFFILSILLWEHFHDGVSSHHILHQKELPAISNWWSGVLLPILTWILLGRIEKRLSKQSPQPHQTNNQNRRILGLFIIGLIFAIFIAVSFTNEYTSILDNVIYLFLLLSLIIPIYYSEFILGFIFGMTYTFGAILPTVFMLIMAAVGILIYRFIRPTIIKLTKIMGNNPTKAPNR
jgi:hypothetical protein